MPAQRAQVCELLAEVLRHGEGRLEIVVEQHQVRWLAPALDEWVGQPLMPWHAALPSTLPAGLEATLSRVMCAGWGRVVVHVDHHQVRKIERARSVRAVVVQSCSQVAG